MEDFRGTRSYSCTRMIPCCSHIPHFHHTPSQFYIRWYLQAKLDIWTIGLIEWQAVKFPLSLLNFAEEKNTIGPSGEPPNDADKQTAFILPGVVPWGHKWKDNYWIFKAKKDRRRWTVIFATAQK